MNIKYKNIILLFLAVSNFFYASNKNKKNLGPSNINPNLPSVFYENRIIEDIIIKGNQIVPTDSLYSKIALKSGDALDPIKIRSIIKTIYAMGYFEDIKVSYIKKDDNKINLIVEVKEKFRVSAIIFKGNNHITEETFKKKLETEKIQWMDFFSIHLLMKKIKQEYKEKQYIHVSVSYKINILENKSIELVFFITENQSSFIKKIRFKDNDKVSHYELKKVIASKEYWLLGFFDKGGMYRSEMTDYDKFLLENFYHNEGFFNAYVKKVDFKEYDDGAIDLTYYVHEGEQYFMGDVTFDENPFIDINFLKKTMPLSYGQLYNRDALKNISNTIKIMLEDAGFMNAMIIPKMKVNEKKKEINVHFMIQQGKKVFLRKINFHGNTKTYSSILRNQVGMINEGELLTLKVIENIKRSVEGLGFFVPQTGVNVKLNPVDDSQVDMDIHVQETRTGRFFFKMGVNGGNFAGKAWQIIPPRWYDSLLSSTNVGLTLQNSNYLGRGIKYYLDTNLSQVDRSFSGGLSTNWFMDYPVSLGGNAVYRTIKYEDFRQSINTPEEKNVGANVQCGFRLPYLDMVSIGLSSGFDVISYKAPGIIPRIQFPDHPSNQLAFETIVRRSFQPGTITWMSFLWLDDSRNHPLMPTTGSQFSFDAKLAIPNDFSGVGNRFGFLKMGIDWRWYTQLIRKYNVVLHLHSYLGFVDEFKNSTVPYKELFHVGGDQSVRGFGFGQIGPSLMGSSLGGKKSFFVNGEILTPITGEGSITAVLFYDGGACWNTLLTDNYFVPSTGEVISPTSLIRNNNFEYRHSVGVGIRMTSPTPIKIDWGFKLDRKKGETPFEVHINMMSSY